MDSKNVAHRAAEEVVAQARAARTAAKPSQGASPLASLSPLLRIALFVLAVLPAVALPFLERAFGLVLKGPAAFLLLLPSLGALLILRHARLVSLRYIIAIPAVLAMLYFGLRWL